MLLIMNYVTNQDLIMLLIWIMLLNQDLFMLLAYVMNYVTQSGLCLCYLLWIMLLNQDFVNQDFMLLIMNYELCYSFRTQDFVTHMLLIMNYQDFTIMLLNQDFVYVTYYELCYSNFVYVT